MDDIISPSVIADRLIGHTTNKKTLLRYITNNPHKTQNWIFHGPKGIGKATCAFMYAHYILQQSQATLLDADNLFGDDIPANLPPDDDFAVIDKESALYRQISTGSHPSISYIHKSQADPEKNTTTHKAITIRHIRQLRQKQQLAHGNAYNIIIIDDADDMTVEASNGLLKFFEEPQDNTIIIIIAHQLSSLLPTIRSRAMKLYFAPLSLPDINMLQQQYCPNLSDDERHAYHILTGGSFGDMLYLYEHDGVEIYQDWVHFLDDIIKEQPIITHKHALVAGAQHKDDVHFTVMRHIILQFLQEITLSLSEKRPFNAVFEKEKAITQILTDKIKLENWLILWNKHSTYLYKNNAPSHLAKDQLLVVFLRDMVNMLYNESLIER